MMLDTVGGRSTESMYSKSKYKNTKVKTNEGVFDSAKEYKRWLELKGLRDRGEITDLSRQVKFELIPHQKEDGRVVELACNYFADFTYYYKGEYVVEDTKGFKTPEYIIKRKLMLQRYGIRIKEV